VNSQGVVSYKQDSDSIGKNPPGSGDTVTSTSSSFVVGGSSGSGGAVNPGGHTLNNNGAVHGNAWWKHPVPGTSQVVTEQIESRSHNEFYDVFKDGQYVGTYQISADATHFTQPGYQLWTYKSNGPRFDRGWHQNGPYVPPVDEWQLANVHVAALPPEPTGLPGDTPIQSDDPDSQDDESVEVNVQIDPDDQDLQQTPIETSESLKPSIPNDLDSIAEALNAAIQLKPEFNAETLGSDLQGEDPRSEAPTPEQIADSLAQLTGDQTEQTTEASQSQVSPQGVEPAVTPPSADEIAEATEQIIAAAPTSAPGTNQLVNKADDQDTFRDASQEPLPPATESLSSDDVLAEETPAEIGNQQEDDPPLLG
jgi:hypothetical protein